MGAANGQFCPKKGCAKTEFMKKMYQIVHFFTVERRY